MTSRLTSIVACVLAACGPPGETPRQAPPAGDVPSARLWRDPGTERMVRRLALLADNAPVMQNEFMNEERLELLLRLRTPADQVGRLNADFRLAKELLNAGRSADAAERFARIAAELDGETDPARRDFRRRVRSLLATAHLRLGEQQNCLERHNPDACLLPILGGGVHRLQQGSRAALAQLAELLREDPEDLTSRWLYNVAAMTVGDYPDEVPAAWLIPPEVFASDREVGRFYDVAAGVGLATVGRAGGAVVEDFDGDGYLDVMASSWGIRDPLRVFRNRRDGTFEEVTEEAGLAGIAGGLNLVHADYDNDGDADVLVLRGAWMVRAGRHPNSLLQNRGDVTPGKISFGDVTEEAGLLTFRPTQTAAWGDFDNDGWLDLFVGNESLPGDANPCELYRNNGPSEDGAVTFTEVAASAGVSAGGYVKGAVWGDFDNDGWIDLYLSRFLEPNLLFHNQGAAGEAAFREIAAEAGVAEPIHSFPTWFVDFDNDGWLDLFVADYSRSFLEALPSQIAADYLGLPTTAEKPRLYRNRGADGSLAFEDVTAAAGLDHVLLAMGANFGDLDNDGYPDFYIGTGAPDFRALVPNRMFRNDGGKSFQDVTTSGGFGHLQKGHGIAFGDLDNDGDQDVFAVLGGAFSGDVYPDALFLNPGHGRRWITLRLEGTRANRSGVGARIRVELETPDGPWQVHATAGTGGSFGSSSLQQEIGLGDALAVRAVEVRWPGGGRQVFHGLAMDRIYRLVEGDPDPAVVELERLDLAGGTGASGHAAAHHF